MSQSITLDLPSDLADSEWAKVMAVYEFCAKLTVALGREVYDAEVWRRPDARPFAAADGFAAR